MATQFLDYFCNGVRDSSGIAAASGTVTFFQAGTTTKQTVFTDFELTIPHPNPLTLDTAGRAFIYSAERVRAIISDSAGTLIKDIDDIGLSDADIEAAAASLVTGFIDSNVFTVTNGDFAVTGISGICTILVTTGSDDRTVTLPKASTSKAKIVYVKKVDSGTGAVIVDAFGAELIDGIANFNLGVIASQIGVISDGAAWHVIEKKFPNITARWAHTTGLNLSDSTQGILTATVELLDTHDAHVDGRFRVPVAGRYLCMAHIKFQANAAWTAGDTLFLEIFVNGVRQEVVDSFVCQVTATHVSEVSGNAIVNAAKGDEIRFEMFQNTGSTLIANVNSVDNIGAVSFLGQ